ncbi:PQQ-binding-like beta-propeller repeat protein [Micromonospora pallida]|uniref:outer membrane protein assembly factor BamB family protein n=1 Tax=Micromonospora pallida TaxID=145854 RepID=UPI00159EF772|nr:PQQ-binding-like beta-propeller repeat protein [Micromonospora pallida]
MIAVLVLVVVRQDGSSGSRPSAARASLPKGGIVSPWELAVGSFSGTAIDEQSDSIALTNYGVGPNEPNQLQVVDLVRGTVRWAVTADVTWVTNPDGTLAATPDGLAFLTTDVLYGNDPVYGVQLSTGELVWRARPSSNSEPRLVGGLLMLETDAGVLALDAKTGAERWQWTADDDCGEYGPELNEMNSGGITAKCGGAIYHIKVADGTTAWRWSVRNGCIIRNESSAAGIVAAIVTCGDDQALHVVDGDSGAQRWSRAIDWDKEGADPADPDQGAAGVAVVLAGDTPMVAALGPGQVYAAFDGKPVPLPPGLVPVYYSGYPGPAGLLLQRDDGRGLTLTVVDPAAGHVVWERALPFPAEHNPEGKGTYLYRFAGGVLYVVGVVPLLWPAVIALIDGQSGDMTLSAAGRGNVDLIGTGVDGTLYLTYGPYGQSRLTALRVTGSSSGFLGSQLGSDQWPDACRLLSAAQYRSAYPGVTPTLQPEALRLPGVELPAPPRCRYLPSAIDGTEVTVSVSWLADAADEARRVAEGQNPYGRDPVAVAVGKAKRPALQWDDTNTGVDLMERIRVSFAVGRCVANVETLGDSSPLVALAGSVADSLANPVVSPGCSA